MKNYRFVLASSKAPKLDCPYCHAKKHWQRYIDRETGEVLPEQYGCCDNSNKCGYHLNPYQDGYAKAVRKQEQGYRTAFPNYPYPTRKAITPKQAPQPVFFDFDTFKQTLNHYEKNAFIQNLLCRVPYPFEAKDVTRVIELYRLGTIASGYRTGAITFPFIDIAGNIQTIQVKQFDDENHTTGTDFLHSIIEKDHTRNSSPLPEWLQTYLKQDKRITCLFGEHLLNQYPNANVYLFEAPKTAIYSTLYFGSPDRSNTVCLAVYNKSSFTFDKVKVLQGRFVYVFPDLSKDGSTFSEWATKAKEYENKLPGTRLILSDYLERFATQQERVKAADLADVLIKWDWREFRKKESKNPKAEKEIRLDDPIPEKAEPAPKRAIQMEDTDFWEIVGTTEIPEIKPTSDWSDKIEELKQFFEEAKIPTDAIRVDQCSIITDCQRFIDSHLETVQAQQGKRAYRPYLDRLQHLMQLLKQQQNET
jgi:hypothetical protein